MKQFNKMTEKRMSNINGGLLFELIGSAVLATLASTVLGIGIGVGVGAKK